MGSDKILGFSIPNALKGPLGSHSNYISHIALPNCVDYFHLVQQQREEDRDSESDKYKRLRYFLNAVESLNNIPEYIFHETKDQKGWADDHLGLFLGRIRGRHKILNTVEEIANASKHCVRKNKGKIHASDLQSPSLSIDIDFSVQTVNVDYDFESIENEDILGDAYRFWVEYLNHPDDRLLPDLEVENGE